ncbi:MAG: TonB-dependent siderophore receptor, partial [Comamonadaceae bacterium]
MSTALFSRPRRAATLRSAVAALCLACAAASAQTPVFVNLPAQPLAQSLGALARQSGVQILFVADVAQGVQAPAVQGTLDVQSALQRLVAGSGLVVRAQDERTFT